MKHYTAERLFRVALIALLGIIMSSCQNTSMQEVGEAAAKPFVKAGEVAVNSTKKVGEMAAKPLKKANPMNWFNKDEEAGDPADFAEGVEAVTPGLEPAPAPAPDIAAPSRNTVTPGAQPAPGVASTQRESLTLPSNPTAVAPTEPAPTPPPTSLDPLPDLPADPPSLLEQPVPPSIPDSGPLSTPPTLTTDDDGFLPLSPKLPEEEDVLPPE